MGKSINENGEITLQKLKQKYPNLCVEGVKVIAFINKVYNEDYKVVQLIKKSIEVPIKEYKEGYLFVTVLDLFGIMIKYGIPKGYYVELTITNFIIKSNNKTILVPIFPNEIKLDCDYGIENVIKRDVESLKKVAEAYEIIGKLSHHNLGEISDDLMEAMIRLEKSDVDGAIKFFRKTIEGLRNIITKDIMKSENRAKELKDYLTKAFHLLSNFGEHAGTEALMNEAIFAKDIALSAARYIIEKLEEL